MIDKKGSPSESCCSCNSGCCTSEQNMQTQNKSKSINIDFLYLDLSVCAPCQGTESVLDDAIKDVANILQLTGIEVSGNKVNVANEELAKKFKFISSPTIRINGHDIQIDVKESSCQTCSDLSGEKTDCRIWVYQGKEYNVPPKAMIVDAILKEVHGGSSTFEEEKEYSLPENLKRFYTAMNGKSGNKSCCCSSDSKCC